MSTRYVWEKWNVIQSAKYVGQSVDTFSIAYDSINLFYGDNYSYDSLYEEFVIENATKITINNGSSFTVPANKWFILHVSSLNSSSYMNKSVTSTMLSVSTNTGDDSSTYPYKVKSSATYNQYNGVTPEKGSANYGNVSNNSSYNYPTNGDSGDYWYVKLGSDTIDPVSLTYTDEVRAGGTINLTINPSNGIIYGGTVTYTIQTTTNGEDYYDAGTTTGTTFAVTVPQDAAIWNVRVYAKDDTGFVSTTYVYGNNIPTWVTVIQSEIVPASGDLGYLTSKNIVAVGVTHVSEQTYSISATLNGEPCFEKSGVAITDATYIILEDETWESIPQETEQTLDVTITFASSTDSRTYTFKKFTYDDTSLEGVMEGMARAIRIKREYQTEILGKNMPKEIIKVDNPVNTSGLKEATASEAQVFAGYTFFAGDSELRTGVALSTPITAVESDVKSGKTYYDNNGVLKTGTRPNDPILLYEGYISLPYSTSEQTYTISPPSSAENWVYFSTVLKDDDADDLQYQSSGTVTKNNRYNSYFGWDGDVQLGGSNIGVQGRMYWNGNQIVIKKSAYGTGHDLKYRFYGYN